MKNADMPAMPIIDDEQSFPIDGEKYGKSLSSGRFAVGMTKREIMAAMLPDVGLEIDSSVVPSFIGRDVNWGDILDGLKASAEVEAIHRVIRADALLAELDRTCQKS